MLAEFVKSIADLVGKSTKFETLMLPDETVMVRSPDGQVHTIEKQPKKKRFATRDLDSFARAIKAAAGYPTVLVGTTQTVAYFDSEFMDESITLEHERSEAANSLLRLGQWTPQREAVAALRDDLWDCVEAPLLAAMRSLDWQRRNDGSKSIEHGRESLGKSVESTVQSRSGALAESYRFELPFYRTAPFDSWSFGLICNLDLDAVNEKVRFVARGDSWSQFSQCATAFAAETISQAVLGSNSDATVLIASET